MKGWRYEWVDDLPVDVYDVLVEEMIKASKGGDDSELDD
jgi:hypothetical protein